MSNQLNIGGKIMKICRDRKLIDKRIGWFLLQIQGQFQFNAHPTLIVAQIPDAFSQNGILASRW